MYKVQCNYPKFDRITIQAGLNSYKQIRIVHKRKLTVLMRHVQKVQISLFNSINIRFS